MNSFLNLKIIFFYVSCAGLISTLFAEKKETLLILMDNKKVEGEILSLKAGNVEDSLIFSKEGQTDSLPITIWDFRQKINGLSQIKPRHFSMTYRSGDKVTYLLRDLEAKIYFETKLEEVVEIPFLELKEMIVRDLEPVTKMALIDTMDPNSKDFRNLIFGTFLQEIKKELLEYPVRQGYDILLLDKTGFNLVGELMAVSNNKGRRYIEFNTPSENVSFSAEDFKKKVMDLSVYKDSMITMNFLQGQRLNGWFSDRYASFWVRVHDTVMVVALKDVKNVFWGKYKGGSGNLETLEVKARALITGGQALFKENLDGRIVGRVSEGIPVRRIEESGEWVRIQINGWVQKENLKENP